MKPQTPPHLPQLDVTELPALPLGCVDGGGAQAGQTLYAGLGSAGRQWHGLDLSRPGQGWTRCADFPGPVPTCPVVIALGEAIYVLGGFGKTREESSTAQLDGAYRYLARSDRWERLPTILPVGLTGATAIAADARTLYVFGGYHRAQFDDFHRELERAPADQHAEIHSRYMGRPIAQFEWNAQVWAFDLLTMGWRSLGLQPHPGHCKATAIVDGDSFYLLGGEVKPGLRASTIKHGRLGGQGVRWQIPQAVPVTDGFAGCFGGRIGRMLVAAGGTHFPGAWKRYAQGEYFAHEGLRKKWLGDVHVLVDGHWRCLGSLPRPRANGISVQLEDGLVLIGGDTDEACPCLDTLWLRAAC